MSEIVWKNLTIFAFLLTSDSACIRRTKMSLFRIRSISDANISIQYSYFAHEYTTLDIRPMTFHALKRRYAFFKGQK